MKRLLPVAAVATTAALLLTGCGSDNGGQSGETKKVTVGISQFVEHPSLDAAREGFVQALKDGGGHTVAFACLNAERALNSLSQAMIAILQPKLAE